MEKDSVTAVEGKLQTVVDDLKDAIPEQINMGIIDAMRNVILDIDMQMIHVERDATGMRQFMVMAGHRLPANNTTVPSTGNRHEICR